MGQRAMRYICLKEAVIQNRRALGCSSDSVCLVAVSKGRAPEAVQELYEAGCRDFAENRLPELLEKKISLSGDIRWHFIGKLQRNKVKKIIGMATLIHSVDSVALAEKISLLSQENGVCTPILLEINSSGEASKSGFSIDAGESAFPYLRSLPGIVIKGLMTLAPWTEDKARIRTTFSAVRHLRDRLQDSDHQLPVLSMGMSDDYSIALEEGATLLRIGRALFD